MNTPFNRNTREIQAVRRRTEQLNCTIHLNLSFIRITIPSIIKEKERIDEWDPVVLDVTEGDSTILFDSAKKLCGRIYFLNDARTGSLAF